MMNLPVFPIPPSYHSDEKLDIDSTVAYCEYLISSGATRLMTTAGTSQFNLLSLDEIHDLNLEVSRLECQKILGVPALSSVHTSEFIKRANSEYKEDKTSLMLLYPDRFYSNDEIVDYFFSAADLSKFPCYIHGMFMRNGRGGTYNFSPDLLNRIGSHPNIVGMKEENSNLADAYKVAGRVACLDFETIVAGGSMRRFLFLETAGANTFLTGVGSLYPQIALDFVEAINSGDRAIANSIVQNIEAPVFDTFMGYGWHRSLRSSLKLMGVCCKFDRSPFRSLNSDEEKSIIDTIRYLEGKLEK